MTVCCISAIATAFGGVIGIVPLLVGLAAGITSVYKYCKAGWREITPCDTDDQDLERGRVH